MYLLRYDVCFIKNALGSQIQTCMTYQRKTLAKSPLEWQGFLIEATNTTLIIIRDRNFQVKIRAALIIIKVKKIRTRKKGQQIRMTFHYRAVGMFGNPVGVGVGVVVVMWWA